MRHDLLDIVSAMNPKRAIVALVTNSTNLTKRSLQELRRAGVGTIHLSLDGADEATNDSFRRWPGHYREVMESIEQAKALGFTVCLSTIIMHGNMNKMAEMERLARDRGVGLVFSPACASGRNSDEEDVLLTDEEWTQLMGFMRDHPRVRGDFSINLSMRQECPGGREKIGISSYGDVIGCAMNPVSFGNVRQEPLATIWTRMQRFPAFAQRSRVCLIAADRRYIDEYIRPLSGSTLPVSIERHPTHPLSFAALQSGTR